jgi:cell division protein FtsI (penicillin-binding protein 3)
MDARREVLGSSEQEPQPGRNMMLTIDENIQFMAEKALDHAMEKTQALNGTVVVQDVHTGQILALAIRPTFNPNNFRHTTPALLKDHAVSDVYEPGSVFKLVTYSTALDQQVAKPDDMIDCQGGQITLAGRVIHDDRSDRGMGVVSVATALAKSSDVAAVKLALKVGPDNFYKYIRAFGFGARTGVELPGETRGLLRPVARWGGSSIGSIAIGQEVAVTPVQLVTMVSTIANGGVYLPPHILLPNSQDPNQSSAALQVPQMAEAFKAGEDLPNPLPDGAHRVISALTAAEMRKMMEGVVLFGTGKPAQLNGPSGAKTAQRKNRSATHLFEDYAHRVSFMALRQSTTRNRRRRCHGLAQGDFYGTAVSAQFADVAQQVPEYLESPRHRLAPQKLLRSLTSLKEDDTEQIRRHQALYAASTICPPTIHCAPPSPPAPVFARAGSASQ